MPLSIKVILDLPHEDWLDWLEIKECSDRWLTYHFGGGTDPERWQAGVEGIKGLIGYVEPRVRERRANPQNDYISALLQTECNGLRGRPGRVQDLVWKCASMTRCTMAEGAQLGEQH